MAGSKSTSHTSMVDKQAEEFKALRGPFADLLKGGFGDIQSYLSGDMTYGGPGNIDNYRAPMTQLERDALGDLSASREPSANDQASEDLVGRTLGGDFLSPENNPGLRDLINYTNQAINEAYNTEGDNQKALFARAGQSLPESSPFAQVQADLSKGRLDAIGKNVAGLTSQAYESERGRQVQAVEQQRSNSEFEFKRQVEYLQATALPRLINEVGFERGFEEFNNRINFLAQLLGVTAQVTAPALGTVGKTRSAGGGFSISGNSSTSSAAS